MITTGSVTALPAGTDSNNGSVTKALFSSAKTSTASTITEPTRLLAAGAPASISRPSAPSTVLWSSPGSNASRSSSSIRL